MARKARREARLRESRDTDVGDKDQGSHGQEKARVLQKEAAGAARGADEDHRAHAGRRPHGGRRSHGGSGGQGGELLHQRISLWHDEYGPQDPEHDRRGAEAHPGGGIRRLRELPGRDAAETAGSGAVGEALHQLPGKDGTGIVAVIGEFPTLTNQGWGTQQRNQKHGSEDPPLQKEKKKQDAALKGRRYETRREITYLYILTLIRRPRGVKFCSHGRSESIAGRAGG